MFIKKTIIICLFLCSSSVLLSQEDNRVIQVGAYSQDISPKVLPARQNGGFLERVTNRVADPLYSRVAYFKNDKQQLAIAIVDSCMLPRTLCDEVKRRVHSEIGLEPNRVLISATHTHTAPSAMNYCLGTRIDPEYAKVLPGWIAKSIIEASKRVRPAEVGHTVFQAPDHTANRRWIRRVGRPDLDPFGERTVQAMMHPGYQNPHYVGPSGPEDAGFSILAARDYEGKPIFFMGNFSMHYFGFGGGFSADYFGRYANQIEKELGKETQGFVGILSQGTSGDLWRGDYSKPRVNPPIDKYTRELVESSLKAYKQIRFFKNVPIGIEEQRITFNRRLPDEKRLEWAKKTWPDPNVRPKNRPQVYAEQAFFLRDNPKEEVVLQAARIGSMGITAIPCEVYALTGLELKMRSPLQPTFNLSLANGAAGYIPPPEQHALGGYNTWPARTAGLAIEAEPIIVRSVVKLLEKVSGKNERAPVRSKGAYPSLILSKKPIAYWRLEEFRGESVSDSSGNKNELKVKPRIAFYLRGPQSPAFSNEHVNRCLHLIDGWLEFQAQQIKDQYSVELWFSNKVIKDNRKVRGEIFRWGSDLLTIVDGGSENLGKLSIGSLQGKQTFGQGWNHLVFTRDKNFVRVFLNGKLDLEGSVKLKPDPTAKLMLGGDHKNQPGLEGLLDEISLFDRALSPVEAAEHFKASGMGNKSANNSNSEKTLKLDSLPKSPEETLRITHIDPQFRLELVAQEPLVKDPVAIDWDLKGRLWVAEMADYPDGMKGGDEPGGRIRILTDDDRDGRYDRSVLYAEGLSFPNGLMVWDRGVLVTTAPHIIYLPDHNDDGKADREVILYDGFLPGNQQLRVNGLRWGLDNWIYCASGGHHAGYGAKRQIEAVLTGKKVHIGSRDIRFNPVTWEMQPESGPSQFGRVRDDWNRWFGVQNSRPLWYYVLKDRYAKRNPYLPTPSAKDLIRKVSSKLYPAKFPQKRYHSFADATQFTSACGPSIYRDRLLFEKDGRTHAFTCDPFHGIVQHTVLTSSGVSFKAKRVPGKNGHDFFASEDRWCRPVMTRTGPDGALYIVDMYRYMIEHPDWLPPHGKEELKPFYRSGEERGRIYRVLPKEGPSPRIPDFSKGSPSNLVSLLGSRNGILRDLAHRTLLLKKPDSMEIVDEHNALMDLHLLSLRDGWGLLKPEELVAALNYEEAQFVVEVLRMSEKFPEHAGLQDELVRLVSHSDLKLILQLACTLGEFKSSKCSEALGRLAVLHYQNPWLRSAIASSLLPHLKGVSRTVVQEKGPVFEAWFSPLFMTAIKSNNRGVVRELIAALVEGELDPSKDLWRLQALESIFFKLNHSQSSLDRLTKDDPKFKAIKQALDKFLLRVPEIIEEGKVSLNTRIALVKLMGALPHSKGRDVVLLSKWLLESSELEFQLAVASKLSQLKGQAEDVISLYAKSLPDQQAALFRIISQNGNWTQSFLSALENQQLSIHDLSLAQRQILERWKDKKIAQKAKALFSKQPKSYGGNKVLAYWPSVTLNGSGEEGAHVFKKNCSTCHQIGNIGTTIGPDLRALTDKSPQALLQSILDPNRSVDPRFHDYTVLTKGGILYKGLIKEETATSIHLKDTSGKSITLLKADIQNMETEGRSFMPEELDESMSLGDMADLLAFLRETI